MGFTNKMAVWLVGILVGSLVMSFILAVLSITHEYMGALVCWTAFAAPLEVGINIVLTATVRKSQAENTSDNGDGIRYRQLIGEKEVPSI